MPLPEGEAQALRRSLSILAHWATPSERQNMALRVDECIREGDTSKLVFLFLHIAALFYPSDEARARELAASMQAARGAGTLASIVPPEMGRIKLSDLAAWPACPPVPDDSPLRYWLPGVTVEQAPSLKGNSSSASRAVTVEMSAPYLSLAILVDAIASAVVAANRGPAREWSEEAAAAALLQWEGKLRELAEAQAIPGHDFDTLAAQPWYLLDIERDVFWVEDLNACTALVDAGLRFTVVQDVSRSGEADFVAAFAEETNNGRQIPWRYWIGQMPSLTAAQACRLLAGLDPDLYEDINARPVPRNNVDDVCKKVVMLERLAIAEGKRTDNADGWLAWARQHKFTTHIGFALAVAEYGHQPPGLAPSEEVVYTLAGYPKLEARTEWTGSWLAGADYFNLNDAAEAASLHAGCDVSAKDFLRAGGRGQISIHAVCRRAAVMAPTRSEDKALNIEAGSFPTLPMSACRAIALFGQAEWRTHEGWVHRDDDLYSFTRWRLDESEPPIQTTLADCLVTGWHVHALADAMKEDAAQPSVATNTPPKASAPPIPPVDRGRRLKRSALISDNVRRWPSIERDLKDAATNGLSDAAKDSAVGWWWEGSALEWARARSKVQETTAAVAALSGLVHRLRG